MRYQELGITASVVTHGAMEADGGFRYPKVTGYIDVHYTTTRLYRPSTRRSRRP